MSVYKNKENGTWYVMTLYRDWTGAKKQKFKGDSTLGEKHWKGNINSCNSVLVI